MAVLMLEDLLFVSMAIMIGCWTVQGLPSGAATGAQPALRAYPATLTVSEGQRAVFYCDAGATHNGIKWTKNAVALREGLGKLENGRLALANVSISDSGVYVCAMAGDTSTKPVTVQLTVIEKEPTSSRNETTVEIQIVRKVASAGEAVSLQCDADFAHPNDVTWDKIGADLPPHAGVTIENGRLTFSSVQTRDAGYYECRDKDDPKTDMVQNLVQLVVSPVLNG